MLIATYETTLRPELDLDNGDGPLSHIVPPEDGVDGAARALEARIMGTAILTLCGYLLVPSRDPQHLPMCTRCLEVFCANTGRGDAENLPQS